KVRADERTGNVTVNFTGGREDILNALSEYRYDQETEKNEISHGRRLSRDFEQDLLAHVTNRVLRWLFVPDVLKPFVAAVQAIPFIVKGLKSLLHGKLDVSVLDAASITVSLLASDHSTSTSIMFLLGLSEILEDYTHRKSVDDLARSMELNIDKVWMLDENGKQVLAHVYSVKEGDTVIVRTATTIPLDGIVISGEMMVNQSSFTGESLPVLKKAGSTVYAGTVVEEGECCIRVSHTTGQGRYDRIVRMIEESEKLKSETETQALHLADRLVPYSFLFTGAVYLLTRNWARAISVLMVDYSCALKLSMPIAVLSAMRECARHSISVKGGQFLENIAGADTVVLDKTGTLTCSRPTVAEVIPFNGYDEAEALRLAACLEEHYPHSIANAVVKEAENRQLFHEERHSRVEYIVAHGIASSIEGKKTVIGSHHFVFEDEHCIVPEEEKEKFAQISDSCSHLYLAVGGVLAAVILIEDPLRPEAPAIIRDLRQRKIDRIVMLTGDSERTAAAIAAKVGVDDYRSEVLPEDKSAYIKEAHEEGRTVIMVGDGVNDSPALSEADCGIAVSDGAAIAREIADVTIADDDLYTLVTLKDISDLLTRRIQRNYRFIMTFNSALILLGAFGVLPASTSAWLHNLSTLAISADSMSNLLPEEGPRNAVRVKA
ncbi:MAG: heavy metal translocating P-type ATPase, partial [Solobacterium sp.]|nr:heavy metal translocating P-type ATPase [Solobacterium sp.]